MNTDRFLMYVQAYLQYHPLNGYDLEMMPYFFWHRLLAFDYYGQYYLSSDDNREDFLYQAKHATKLIR